MGIDRSRRITLEEVANLYNETRTLYPDALDFGTQGISFRARKPM